MKFLAYSLPVAMAGLLASSVPAAAALAVGTNAPLFSAQASLGGAVFPFDLRAALSRGPVVLYFYPAAFTEGCTIEAHDFASHIDAYKALGATVIGVSGDDIATLKRFSVSACRSKFAVAADPGLKIARTYEAQLSAGGSVYANRTSYVIAPSGRVVYTYTSLDPGEHVANTLAAVRKLEGK